MTLWDTRLSVRQLVHLGVVAAVAVGLPYFTAGLVWAGTHHRHLDAVGGLDKLFSVVGEVVAWPVLIIANVYLR
ncbi:hypothetical protein ACAG26_10135 [Mycobacterium sp. pUA109]|uniref:hypothetical protein n=1 Tax=Mycobacterium sp. pUA109 TaxID=3238982 RepID=UPI00351BB153